MFFQLVRCSLAAVFASALLGISAAVALEDAQQSARAKEEAKQTQEERDLLETLKSENQRRYAELLLGGGALPALNLESPAKGAIGRLPGDVYTVVQVLDPRNMLISREWHSYSQGKVFATAPGSRPRGIAPQITGTYSEGAWVEGIDTSDVVDESELDLRDRIFEVQGTKTYETDDESTSTVRHLRLVEPGGAVPNVVGRIQRLRAFRVWEDSTGKHATRAMFVAFKGGQVRLESPEGKERSLPLNRLSKVDQQWVRDEVKRGKAKPAAR